MVQKEREITNDTDLSNKMMEVGLKWIEEAVQLIGTEKEFNIYEGEFKTKNEEEQVLKIL